MACALPRALGWGERGAANAEARIAATAIEYFILVWLTVLGRSSAETGPSRCMESRAIGRFGLYICWPKSGSIMRNMSDSDGWVPPGAMRLVLPASIVLGVDHWTLADRLHTYGGITAAHSTTLAERTACKRAALHRHNSWSSSNNECVKAEKEGIFKATAGENANMLIPLPTVAGRSLACLRSDFRAAVMHVGPAPHAA